MVVEITHATGSGTTEAQYLAVAHHAITNLSGAPIFVAASDAAVAKKKWAVITGGTVCDGTNDQTDVATAEIADNGAVHLSHGTFNIQAAVTFNHGVPIIGQGDGEEDWVTSGVNP